MTAKTTIVRELEQDALLVPELVAAALQANDRAKYYLGLLQAARANAEAPDSAATDLAVERRAAGVVDEALDHVVAQSERVSAGRYRIPGAGVVIERLFADVDAMLAPLRQCEPSGNGSSLSSFERRLHQLSDAAPAAKDDVVPGPWIAAATASQPRDGDDSVHLLVMGLHKAINRLQERLSRETVDGARCYGLSDDDRARVSAFMRGLNRTARLKFDHPGLGTTATRAGTRLVLQNDIGTTDAHVVVIHVEGLRVTLTYTDVHIQRLEFFQRMFDGSSVAWHDTRSRRLGSTSDGSVFYLCIGEMQGSDLAAVDEFLTLLGSRLVFLIDWNRARKRLRPFIKKRDAVALLAWAAAEDIGHRGFLQLGGEQLIFDAMERVAKTPFRFGERIDDVLGREAAIEYLRYVFRTASEGLLQGRSESLLREVIRTELFHYFQSLGERMLDRVADQAALVVELAGGLRDGLLRLGLPGAHAKLVRDAARAKAWEKHADSLVIETRKLVARTAGTAVYLRLMEVADDVADGLEEAAFHLTLLPEQPARDSDVLPPLRRLGELLFAGSRDLVRCVETARHLRRGAEREDMQAFLAAVDGIVRVEHETDEVERQVTAALRRCELGGQPLREGDLLSLDCSDGGIYAGRLAEVAEAPERELALVASWRDAKAGAARASA
ncbi:MAG: hypothetical protein R3B13_34490 [Polyangiaceae bacterium]